MAGKVGRGRPPKKGPLAPNAGGRGQTSEAEIQKFLIAVDNGIRCDEVDDFLKANPHLKHLKPKRAKRASPLSSPQWPWPSPSTFTQTTKPLKTPKTPKTPSPAARDRSGRFSRPVASPDSSQPTASGTFSPETTEIK